ncbi:aspartate kinase, partial [Candidatus Liberibacter asiaticus]
MLEMSSLGAKVMQVRSVELAMLYKMCLFVRSSFEDHGQQEQLGTLICSGEDIMEKKVITGIAYTKDEAQISLRRLRDHPGISA